MREKCLKIKTLSFFYEVTFVYCTCLSEDSKGHRQLIFALRQECDGDGATDLLQLVGMSGGMTQEPENLSHRPPLLLLGTKLIGQVLKKTVTFKFNTKLK